MSRQRSLFLLMLQERENREISKQTNRLIITLVSQYRAQHMKDEITISRLLELMGDLAVSRIAREHVMCVILRFSLHPNLSIIVP